jgi:hypothetical protein
MSGIDCRGGHTQIAKVLAHARRENESPGHWSADPDACRNPPCFIFCE